MKKSASALPSTKQSVSPQRLPRNFHDSFKPERTLLASLLRFAALGKDVDMQELANATQIPTGKSTGKLLPTILYCKGMGLIHYKKKDALIHLELTPFGQVVLFEDSHLSLALTQWLAHAQLCHPLKGADPWYQLFVHGYAQLGLCFDRDQAQAFLAKIYQSSSPGLLGTSIRTYTDSAALGNALVLTEEGKKITRKSAPLDIDFYRGYGALLVQHLSDFFPGQQQIPVFDYLDRSGFAQAFAWDQHTTLNVLGEIERLGLIRIDRHMQPWLLSACLPSEHAWRSLFDDLL